MLLLVPGTLWAYTSFDISLETGYVPNALGMKYEFEALQKADQRVAQRMVTAADYYGDRVQISDVKSTGSELVAIPVGVKARFIYNRLFFRLGFLYHNILPSEKSYILRTRPGIDSELAANGVAHNFYDDYYKNHDTDMSNDVPMALGLIPTDGNSYLFRSVTTAEMVEVPFTFGLILIGKRLYKYYIGAGLTWYRARTIRTVSAFKKNGNSFKMLSGPNSRPDVDEFAGSAIGFHFTMGSEYQVTPRTGLFMEFTYSLGVAVPIEDRVRTNADTVDSLYHSNDLLDAGGSETPGSVTSAGLPRISGINFESVRLSAGVSFLLNITSDPDKVTGIKEITGKVNFDDKRNLPGQNKETPADTDKPADDGGDE